MTATVVVALWIALAAAAAVLQAVALVARRIPTFGDATGHVMRWWIGRVVLVGGWIWIGFHTFVRSHPG